jgi:redox-sensing transcriptional repressor
VKSVTIPKATVARLPLYLHAIDALQAAGTTTVSSEMLAKRLNVNAGTQIRQALGLTRDFGVVIVGVGHLGTALANYGGFGPARFHIVGLYDADEAKIGAKVGGLVIRHIRHLASDIAENTVEIGIITTPAAMAQEVAEKLEECGVRSILNFAQTVLQVEHAEVRRVDLSTELQILGYYVRSDRS